MEHEGLPNLNQAIEDFRKARRVANMESLLSGLRGKSDSLLSFEEVRTKLNLVSTQREFLTEIPLDSIVGSVGRYLDFNRQFLPLTDSDQDRWTRVKVAQVEKGLPPIDVYKIGEAYFVFDGNHRVSIARQMGNETIEAWVTEYRTRVALSPDDQIEDVIVKAEQVEFFEKTKLDELRPDLEISVTVLGRIWELYEHILVHQYYLGIEKQRDILIKEAVESWADNVYLPVVEVVRQQGVLRDFPGRTEADLYLWLKKHQAELAESLDWQVEPEKAASDLVRRFSSKPGRVLEVVRENFMDLLMLDSLESGPPVGEWRVNMVPRRDDRMFSAILVSVSGSEQNWLAFEQALPVAKREEAVLRGLHVVRSARERDSKRVKEARDKFMWRCGEEGVKGEFSVEVGKVTRSIVKRSTWSDLVILHLFHPPGDRPLARLKSGIRTILQRSPRPVLAVPNRANKLERVLLAYDGSPKSEEALFLAAYVGCCWGAELVVLGATDLGEEMEELTLERARRYLEQQGITANYVSSPGLAGDVVLKVAKEHQVDMIVMGGYGKPAWWSLFVGSTVEKVLREFGGLVLVCR